MYPVITTHTFRMFTIFLMFSGVSLQPNQMNNGCEELRHRQYPIENLYHGKRLIVFYYR